MEGGEVERRGPLGGDLKGMTAGGSGRLRTVTKDITQTKKMTANALGAVSTTGAVLLSLATNDVVKFAASATTAGKEVDYQDATAFEVGQVTAGGPFGANLDGITTSATGRVRLQAVTGDITDTTALTGQVPGAWPRTSSGSP